MSDSLVTPWSNGPNAPQIPSWLYKGEKENFAGSVLGAVFYGIVIVLFFQCMHALLNPINRANGGVRWALVALTAAMFSIVTIFIAVNLNILSISYIDNRVFIGENGTPPGPLGYQLSLSSKPIGIVPNAMFCLNNWLADGLLLYRCYVIYSRNHLAIIVPSLMYLASVAMGLMVNYELAQPIGVIRNCEDVFKFGVPYFSVTFSLNLLLTLMIVVRLVQHKRSIKNAAGTLTRADGLYKTVVDMLVESCTLYVVTLALYVVPWAAKEFIQYTFWSLLANFQVIGPFLIVLRVADQRAFSSDDDTSANCSSINFRSQRGSTSNGGSLPSGQPMSSMHGCGEFPVRSTIEDERVTDPYCKEV